MKEIISVIACQFQIMGKVKTKKQKKKKKKKQPNKPVDCAGFLVVDQQSVGPKSVMALWEGAVDMVLQRLQGPLQCTPELEFQGKEEGWSHQRKEETVSCLKVWGQVD